MGTLCYILLTRFCSSRLARIRSRSLKARKTDVLFQVIVLVLTFLYRPTENGLKRCGVCHSQRESSGEAGNTCSDLSDSGLKALRSILARILVQGKTDVF